MKEGDVGLDHGQYALDGIRNYESVYGRDFVSPGGEAMARECVAMLELSARERVLDVGCGLGGSAFLMARELGVRVHGVDLSQNMITLARARCRAHGLDGLVTLERADCLELEGEALYDAVYSRDVFLHIAGKHALFTVLARLLAPGGRLLFTDYCRNEGVASREFVDYIEAHGYSLATIDEYRAHLERAGFESVEAMDWTDRFIEITRDELARLRATALDADARAELTEGWESKLDRARRGEQRWGCFRAHAPPCNSGGR